MADAKTKTADTDDDGRDTDALPSPQEKYEQSYEADRKRLAAEHVDPTKPIS